MKYAVLLALTAWVACAGPFTISPVSTRAGFISGGDVLVRVHVPAGDLSLVRLNEKDITSLFRREAESQSFLALVTGLKPGANSLEVFRNPEDRSPSASLQLENHPVTGPVFSGPHEQPFICETAAFRLPDGSTLGAPVDTNCSVVTVVQYLYRSTRPEYAGAFRVMPTGTELPDDIAPTTISTGQTVPYIVRLETGTVNRAIYQIAVLHDPSRSPSPFETNRRWNGRLLYSFGGGCTEGWFRQGNTTALGMNTAARGNLTDWVLSSGYAYASASLNVFGMNCQDVTAAETMMMVKERFIEEFGPPLFTFGRGGSGGAYQQVQIADNYPGLLDGIIPSATFPDVLETIQYLTDAQLLHSYFSNGGAALTEVQKKAISGVGELNSVSRIASGAGRINPRVFCPPVLPQSMRYDPQTNPTGARCDVFDHTVNVYGRDAATGFARRPVDNTGVQYGLMALNSGILTIRQFLDLNAAIGGHDNNGNIVGTRSVADEGALLAAYRTGRVTNGGGGLATVPILDLRGYLDLNAGGDIHLKYHSFAFRERLLRANGTSANQVLIVTTSNHPRIEEHTIAKMDEWLTSLKADVSADPTLDRIARSKPADLVDACYSRSGEKILERQTFAGGECNKLYPTFPSPRMMAGGPATNDVLKCQVKPIDFTDYRVDFTPEEKRRLSAIFPSGVCDWTKAGVAQGSLAGVWLRFDPVSAGANPVAPALGK